MFIQEGEAIKIIISGKNSEKEMQRAARLFSKYISFDYSKRYVRSTRGIMR